MRKERFTVFALLACALAIRVAFALVSHVQYGDEPEYVGFAMRVIGGDFTPFKNGMLFVRAPGYPYFMALVWLLTGSHSLLAVKLAQAVVGTGTCVYAYRLAGLLKPPPGGALFALACAAFYPYLVYYTGAIGTEGLFAFFVAAGTFHLAKGIADGAVEIRHVVLSGFLYALGNMIRPNLSTVYPLLGLWLAYRYRREPRRIISVGLALAIPLLAITLPWAFASAHAGMGFVWVTDGGGIWYWVGHNDSAARYYCQNISVEEYRLLSQEMPNPVYDTAAALPPPAQQSAYWHAALAWDRQHVSVLPCLMVKKLAAYWRLWVNPVAFDRTHMLISLVSLGVVPVGFLGLVQAVRRGERALSMPVIIQIVTGTIVAMTFSTQIRYRVPIADVLLIPFFGYACATLLTMTRERRRA
jgi:hypothetical protein